MHSFIRFEVIEYVPLFQLPQPSGERAGKIQAPANLRGSYPRGTKPPEYQRSRKRR